MVVLGRTDLSQAQVNALTDWVQAGGDLVALRPDPALGGLLGLTSPSGTLSEGYLAGRHPERSGPGHRRRDHAVPRHRRPVGRRGRHPGGRHAVQHRDRRDLEPCGDGAASVGSSGGSASAFTYDLAQSVVLTRQGNPAWVNQNRDGEDGPNRADDLFFGPMVGDLQANYVDLSKVGDPPGRRAAAAAGQRDDRGVPRRPTAATLLVPASRREGGDRDDGRPARRRQRSRPVRRRGRRQPGELLAWPTGSASARPRTCTRTTPRAR